MTTYYGVEIPDRDPKPGGLAASITAPILLNCYARAETERLDRLLRLNADKQPDEQITSDQFNERKKTENYAMLVRAFRMLGMTPPDFERYEHVDLFAK